MNIIFILAVLFAVAGITGLGVAVWHWIELKNLPYEESLVYWLLLEKNSALSFVSLLLIVAALILFIA